MEDVGGPAKLCIRCLRSVSVDGPFCNVCGSFQVVEEEVGDDHDRNRWLQVLVIFYVLDLIICTVVNFSDYFRGLKWLFITEVILAVLTLLFTAILWKSIRPLFGWKSFSRSKCLVYVIAAVIFAIIVNILVKWVNQTIFNQDVYYYRSFRHLAYPKLGMVVLVALLPAIFEELSYRGIILHSLLKISYQRQANVLAAFLFAVIHMSFISFFWLMPFAIWLGNVRLKEHTIWYGVLIHFSFNLTACLFEFFELKLMPFQY